MASTGSVSNFPLHQAAARGDTAAAERLLTTEGVAGMSSRDMYNRTPLMHAAANGHPAMLQLLVKALPVNEIGPAMQQKDSGGMTVVHHAAVSGSLQSLDLLLPLPGAATAISMRTESGWTSLHVAAANGFDSLVSHILQHSDITPDVINAQDRGDLTALMVAAQKGHAAVVHELLQNPAAAADLSISRCTHTVMLAAASGHSAVVQLLLRNRQSHERTAILQHHDDQGQTLMHHAVLRKDAITLQQLLSFPEAAAAIGISTNNGLTPLHLAAEGGHEAMVAMILQDSAIAPNVINKQSKEGSTALMLAAAKGHVTVVSMLLEAAACQPDLQSPQGTTALMLAAARDRTAVIQLLLAGQEPDVLASTSQQVDKQGRTVMHHAASCGSTAAVEQLLSYPQVAAVTKRADEDGRTPLHLAAKSGFTSTVAQLLQDNATPAETINVQCSKGLTALMMAAQADHVDVVHKLLSVPTCDLSLQCSTEGATALTLAASNLKSDAYCRQPSREESHPVLSVLLTHLERQEPQARKDAIERQDRQGRTIVHRTASRCNTAAMMQLLSLPEAAAATGILNNDGWTPLQIAVDMGHQRGAVMLLQDSATTANIINKPNKEGCTALMLAAASNFTHVVRRLLETAACQPDLQSLQGTSALMLAAGRNHMDVIQLLLAGREPDALASIAKQVDDQGWTVMHHAARGGSTAALEHLLSFSQLAAVMGMANRDGRTPLHLAVESGAPSSVAQLLQDSTTASMIINKQCSKGFTALMMAVQADRPQADYVNIVRELLKVRSCDLNLQCSQGATALMMAATASDHQGPNWDLSRPSNHVPTVLMRRAFRSDQQDSLFEVLLSHLQLQEPQARMSAIQWQDHQGLTVVHHAAERGNTAALKQLLSLPEATAAVAMLTKDGLAPLHLAAQVGHQADVAMILQSSAVAANNNDQSREGLTALMLAAAKDPATVVSKLLGAATCQPDMQSLQGTTALMLAASRDRAAVIQLLLAGREPDALASIAHQVDHQGWTVMHHAARGGSTAALQHLLSFSQLSAVTGMVDRVGRTPLHLAVGSCDPSSVAQLLQDSTTASMIINVQCSQGLTALMMAVQADSPQEDCVHIVRELLKVPGCNLSLQCSQGATALMMAASRSDRQDPDEDLSPQSSQRATALMMAASGPDRQESPLEVLLSHLERQEPQARMSALTRQDHQGRTVVHYAASSSVPNIAAMKQLLSLPEAAAATSVEDSEGRTALSLACDSPVHEILRKFLSSPRVLGYRWTPSILQGLFDVGVAAVVASLKFLRYGHSVSDQEASSTLADPARAKWFLMQLPQKRQASMLWPWAAPEAEPQLPPAIAFKLKWWHGLSDETMDSICQNLDAMGYRPLPSSEQDEGSVDFVHLCALQAAVKTSERDVSVAATDDVHQVSDDQHGKRSENPAEEHPPDAKDQQQPLKTPDAAAKGLLTIDRRVAPSASQPPQQEQVDFCADSCEPHAFTMSCSGPNFTDEGIGSMSLKWTNRSSTSLLSRMFSWLPNSRCNDAFEGTFKAQIKCCCEHEGRDRCLKVHSIEAEHGQVLDHFGRRLYVYAAALGFERVPVTGQQARDRSSLGTGPRNPHDFCERWYRWSQPIADIERRKRHFVWSAHLGMHLEAGPEGFGLDLPSMDIHEQPELQVLRKAGEQLATHVVQLQTSGTFKVIHDLSEQLARGGADNIGQNVSFKAEEEVMLGHHIVPSGPLLYRLIDVTPSNPSTVRCPTVRLRAFIYTVRLKPSKLRLQAEQVQFLRLVTQMKEFDGIVQIEMQ